MNKKRGFTVVEISVVVSIAAILICIGANIFVRMRAHRNYDECTKRLSAIADIIKSSRDNNGDYPKDKPAFTSAIGKYNADHKDRAVNAVCPVDNMDYEYVATYDPISEKKGFKCWCSGSKCHSFVIKEKGFVLKTDEHLPCFTEEGTMEPSDKKD